MLIVIPARLGSWRFPNKPLTMIEGMPMIEHVYRRSLLVNAADEVVVAVCEDKVLKACEAFGAKVVMTDKSHQTATDRVAEAAKKIGYVKEDDIVINVQGDEPVVPPPVIEMTVERLLSNSRSNCANLVEEIKDLADLSNHHRIKAVISKNNRLIYLTRQQIPASVFDINKRANFYRQTCIMAFRGPFLQYFFRLERTPLELIEGIDMLRLIENDFPIASGVSPYLTHPVDIPEDVHLVVKLLKKDKWFRNGY
ncbi:MAG: 3-deoxy-manno-octulosonate cytidylyltransferase [Candidatus Omnitrophica bacterium]|nr:3-deoxy-manno-octulosonate cytidylyltransferase [Candidatus Omnitrophota bacterium]